MRLVRCKDGRFWSPLISAVVLCLSLMPSAYAEHLLDRKTAEYNQRIESRLIVNLYHDLVDKGAIQVYEHTLRREDVIPVSVAHNYLLENDELVVHIFSKLRSSIPIPGQPSMVVHAVTVVLNMDGQLQSVIYHARQDTAKTDP